MKHKATLPVWANPLIDRLVSAIVTAIIAWLIGVMQGQHKSEAIIKQLDADVINAMEVAEYFRK